MTSSASTNLYKPPQFPGEIISHAVWLYFRYALSHRDVEELLCVRGVIISYEAIRQWRRKFGQAYANQLRRCRPRPGDKWHLDEVSLTINGECHYLWRAVDQDGNGSSACGSSSPYARHNGFSPRMVPLPNTSDLADVACPRPNIVKKCAKDFKFRRRSRAPRWLLKSRVGPRLVRLRLSAASRRY